MYLHFWMFAARIRTKARFDVRQANRMKTPKAGRHWWVQKTNFVVWRKPQIDKKIIVAQLARSATIYNQSVLLQHAEWINLLLLLLFRQPSLSVALSIFDFDVAKNLNFWQNFVHWIFFFVRPSCTACSHMLSFILPKNPKRRNGKISDCGASNDVHWCQRNVSLLNKHTQAGQKKQTLERSRLGEITWYERGENHPNTNTR